LQIQNPYFAAATHHLLFLLLSLIKSFIQLMHSKLWYYGIETETSGVCIQRNLNLLCHDLDFKLDPGVGVEVEGS